MGFRTVGGYHCWNSYHQECKENVGACKCDILVSAVKNISVQSAGLCATLQHLTKISLEGLPGIDS